jgi:organic radical activating enzyme
VPASRYSKKHFNQTGIEFLMQPHFNIKKKPPEKRGLHLGRLPLGMLSKQEEFAVEKGTLLPLMEAFYTIQGEGYHTGKPAYFIRLGGCDVGCHWCDVKESWDAKAHPPTPISTIVADAVKYSKTIVITGGEPLMWDMGPLTKALHEAGMRVHLETSGAYPFSGEWDWICLSPKKTMPPKPEWYEKAQELKVIVYNQNDFQWAEKHAAQVSEACKRFLQPEWSRSEKLMPQLTDYVMHHPSWRMSLQTHKYMRIP